MYNEPQKRGLNDYPLTAGECEAREGSPQRLAQAGEAVTQLVTEITRVLNTIAPRPEQLAKDGVNTPRPVPTLATMLEQLPAHVRREVERGYALLEELKKALGI
jgi:hypothetical protein